MQYPVMLKRDKELAILEQEVHALHYVEKRIDFLQKLFIISSRILTLYNILHEFKTEKVDGSKVREGDWILMPSNNPGFQLLEIMGHSVEKGQYILHTKTVSDKRYSFHPAYVLKIMEEV